MTDFNTPFPTQNIKKRNKLAIRILAKSVVYAFALFGILFILLLLAVLGLLRQEAGPIANVPRQAVLTVNFDEGYSDIRGDTLLTELGAQSPTAFFDIVRAIYAAAGDERIKAIAARISVSRLEAAQIEELQEAILYFRQKGKKTYLFSPGFGVFGGGLSEYYLASVFDEIWLQPNGEAGITGISIEVPFARKLLKKIGLEAEFFSRYEYKTAMASLTDEKMSKPFREEMERLGQAFFGRMVNGIAENRGLPVETVKKAVNIAPFGAQKALDLGLVDAIGYEPEMMDKIKKVEKAATFQLNEYAADISDYDRRRNLIAFLTVEGIIEEGQSLENPLGREAHVGAETVISQLEEIADNKNVKALVLRINSPGGSYTASNAIWYALKRFKENKKIPVIVSMGNYAASGGYFIALGGDKILADPLTITGSIGVLGGKFVLAGLWEKLGVNWTALKFGENAGIMSANQKFSKQEKDIFNKSLDRVYKDFTLKVSEARGLNPTEIDRVARGRVWTGAAAKDKGLVDELGGWDKAFRAAIKEAGLKPEDKVGILYYPKQKSFGEKISALIGSVPSAAVSKIGTDYGINETDWKLLNRLNYELMTIPFKMNF